MSQADPSWITSRRTDWQERGPERLPYSERCCCCWVPGRPELLLYIRGLPGVEGGEAAAAAAGLGRVSMAEAVEAAAAAAAVSVAVEMAGAAVAVAVEMAGSAAVQMASRDSGR